MDYYAFASLAQLRILLLPVGAIQHSTFDKFAAEIRTFEEIRLGDIPVDNKDERARFMPNPLSTGHLHLSFPSHPPPISHTPLCLLRPSNFPLAVIGVATCSDTDALADISTQFNTLVAEIFPAGSTFPLARNCFVYEAGDGNAVLNLGENLPGLVVIPSVMGNKKLYIGTLLADLCSHVIGEFGVLVHVLESPLGNEYLNSTSLPTLPLSNELTPVLESSARRDSLPPLPTYGSQQELSAPSIIIGRPPGMKRNSSSSPGMRQSSLNVANPKKRLSSIGVASSHGRLFKILADFFMLSGRTEDALIWYQEAIVLLKLPQDMIWHASALEGLATLSILDAWSNGHGLNGSTSNTTEQWGDVSERLTQAAALYYKAPSNDAEQNYPLLTHLYCSAVLRHASLLFSIWSAKGWGPLAFTAMLQPGSRAYLPPTVADADNNSWSNLERLSIFSRVSRSMIAAALAPVHGPWLLHLGPRERISVLENLAGLYACLGYRRKEAYVLREVLGCILDLIVCGREEDGYSRTVNTPRTGLGFQTVTMPGNQNSARGNMAVRQNEVTEGNESILKLLKYICEVFGINLDAVRLLDENKMETQEGLDREEKRSSTGDREDVMDTTEMSEEPSGWPELQVGVVREAVAVAESLPNFPAVAQFALSSLKTLHTVLSHSDQYHLYTTSARALATAKRRGYPKFVEYWSGQPVLNISISPLPFIRVPIEKPISLLSAETSQLTAILPGAADAFLYNPRKLATQEKTLIVRNEILEIIITLRNPYIFDLEIEHLAISTSGVVFESKPLSVVIPSNTIHTVTITGRPAETGTLTIRGCIVRAPGGASREFVLPMFSPEDEELLTRRRAALECEMGRSKYSGLQSLLWTKPGKRLSSQVATAAQKPRRFLECQVVPEQPLLRIRRTSLPHGAVMLYNGEMSVIRMTLENVSSLPIDFLRLLFDDSTIVPAQQALADGELSVFDTYETEYDLIHRPMFTWSSGKDFKEIAPGKKITLTITCFGKVGCTSGTIHATYSYIKRPQVTPQTPLDSFHTRQLAYPVMVTVYHMLECHSMDIIPFSSYEIAADAEKPTAEERAAYSRLSALKIDDESSWCLFSIDVRNTYGLPFEVTFDRVQEETPPASTTSIVPPGSTSRILIPVKKFTLPEEQVSKAIPTLSERQFVVSKSTLTSAEERGQMELFWYREELFKSVRGRWKEAGGIRSGDLSLRKQRMTLPMLETLRKETARVQMCLTQSQSNEASQTTTPHSGARCQPRPNEFLCLQTKVVNSSAAPLILTLDLHLEPSDYVIYEGILRDIPIGHLEIGESREVGTAICFLAYGGFEFSATVRTLGSPGVLTGAGQLKVSVKEST